jgi:hypothetical protein
MRHRLFAVDVFARGDAIENDAPVLEIRDRNDDRFYVFAIEEFAIVSRGGDVGTVRFYTGFAMHVVKVGGADQLSVGHFASRAQEVASANPSADRGEADLPIAGSRQNGGFEQNRFSSGARRRGACTETDEFSA